MTASIELHHVSKTVTSPRHQALARLASRVVRPELVLKDISFSVREGEIACIIGASGSGKSTLLKLIADVWKPDASEENPPSIEVEPAAITDRVWLPQRATLVDYFTVRRNVEIGAQASCSYSRVSRSDVDEVLALVGLQEWQNARPFQLSGGMQQRVALARVLVARRSVMLLDEPFSGLDLTLRRNIAGRIRERVMRDGVAAIFTSHTIEESIEVATRIYVLAGRPGRIDAVVRDERARADDICEAVDISCGTPRDMLACIYDRLAKVDRLNGDRGDS